MSRSPAYKRHWITAKRAQRATCGHDIAVGDVITWRPFDRATECNACAHGRVAQIEAERSKQPELPLR